MKIKNIIKSFLKTLHTHSHTGEDILIISLPRSGSTLLAEILNSASGVQTAGEPMAITPQNYDVLLKYFHKDSIRERYFKLSQAEKNGLFKYLDDITASRTYNSINWHDILRSTHNFRTWHTVIKTLRFTGIFDELEKTFPGKIIYLLRHPAANALSRLNNQWGPYLEAFKKESPFFKKLTSEQTKHIETTLQSGSPFERFVTSWCLENYPLISKLDNYPSEKVLIVTYEELISTPESTIKNICNFTNLPFHQKMKNRITIPSQGIIHSNSSTRKNIVSGQTSGLLNWQNKLSEENLDALENILKIFNVAIYNAHQATPTEVYKLANKTFI